MRCHKCLSENSDRRKFCGECGLLIVAYCQKCGFDNSLTDKYCGGCGINLSEVLLSAKQDSSLSQASGKPFGKYSTEDVAELFQGKSEKTEKKQKKKESRDAEPVSQDFLDSMFDSSGSD